MDLAGMINDGAAALHRGSVDKTGSSPSTPVLMSSSSEPGSDLAREDASETAIAEVTPIPSRNMSHNLRERRTVGGKAPPKPTPTEPSVWAEVYKGPKNKVKDRKRQTLAQTRPELRNLRIADSEPSSNSAPRSPNFHGTPASPSNGGHKSPLSRTPYSPRHNSFKAHQSSPFPPFSLPATRVSEIGPGGNLSLTGLAPSMAALIPSDDQTRVLAGWLYEQTQNIQDTAMLNFVEVEFKMGQIANESNLRHRFPVLGEAIVDPHYWRQENLKFCTAIDESAFRSLESLMDSLEVANTSNENNVIRKSNQLITDEVYHIQLPSGTKGRVRVSRDDRGRVVECIQKNRVNDMFISMPNCPFDLKVSISTENPIDYNEIVEPQIGGTPSSFERNKNRLKYTSKGCTVDLTSVLSRGAHNSSATPIKEGEIEANMELLGAVLQEIRSASNPAEGLNKFLEIIRYTFDSARFLLRNI